MDRHIRELIAEGENQKLDFKYCVSDSRKIARTLSAFANTDGGRLLIGVRDNGSIAGIRSDEEIYMVDTAAHIFCRPVIEYSLRQHVIGGKTILEVEVSKGNEKPYQAMNEEGRWISWIRHLDQNLSANRVLLQIWRKEKKGSGVLVKFGKAENMLMEYLQKNASISLSKFRKISGISAYRAESILANLVIFRVLVMNASEKGFTYSIGPDTPAVEEQLITK
ncbi:MAG TPA: ATP-binding protein [Bacteroidales bacterium]|jgi:predicted HTH transcriptional regulator|nr:ATP-binding protein [Bacteroidales bacterium]NLK55060.1 ATP-binding protein [Bacteroidales bacterium]HNY53344.1 ATP-binding protein [Bacteroidales bacterium]HOG57418.1 ATP-binding protein [Bacteroidales bacterium]HPB14027.1 ATP-binding protein [Bacteroidales bacterium]